MTDQRKHPALGRPVGFDREAVLETAMEFLWEGGFETTPVGELIEVMGLSRSSFYATFESKRGVFLEALAFYSRQCLDLLAEIERSDAEPRAKIRDMIHRLARVGEDRGCFMANSISGQARHDPEVQRLAAAHNDAIERVLVGILPPEAQSERTIRARAIIAAAYGATLLRTAGMGGATIREMLDALVDRA